VEDERLDDDCELAELGIYGGSSTTPPTIFVSFNSRPDNKQFHLPYFFPRPEIYLNSQPILVCLAIDSSDAPGPNLSENRRLS
jgi:hypothetical protein